jgi:hypothetical protein
VARPDEGFSGRTAKAVTVSDRPARRALAASLRSWRRHLLAAGVVAAGFGAAAALDSPVVRYGAVLLAFAVWMLWFVLTAVEWIRHADF